MEILCSVILVHYAMNEVRSKMMRQALPSVITSLKHLPCELIVLDNGGSKEDSEYLTGLTEQNEITTYVKFSNNRWFGHARNQGAKMAQGKYLAFLDNDVTVMKGWLEDCIRLLEGTNEKVFATPLMADRAHIPEKYWKEPITVGGEKYSTNSRAGSNCWVMKKEDFLKVGLFPNNFIAGTKWNNWYMELGYRMALTGPEKVRGLHLGEHLGNHRRGYRKDVEVSIYKKLTNGEEVLMPFHDA